jgi:hypothetical protein
MVSDILMDDANEVGLAVVLNSEIEFSGGVSFGVSRFFHALRQLYQDDIVPSGRLIRGSVGYGTGESIGGCGSAEKDCAYKGNRGETRSEAKWAEEDCQKFKSFFSGSETRGLG